MSFGFCSPGLYNKYMEFFVSPVSQLPHGFEDITVSSLVHTGNNQLKSKGILYDLMKLLVSLVLLFKSL